MNCRDAESLVAAGVYGRLTPEERAALEGHARTCPACSALLEKWAGIHELSARAGEDDVPLPDWEKSWARIAAATIGKRPRRRSVFGWLSFGGPAWARWAGAAASVILVFAVGYFAGRRFLTDRSSGAIRPAAGRDVGISALSGSVQAELAEYADNLRPILADFLNRGDVRPPNGLLELRRRVVRDMLGQTRLLMGLAEESGDAGLKDLLSELEFVLTSLANMERDDKDSADHLGRMIRERGVAARLRDLAAFSTI